MSLEFDFDRVAGAKARPHPGIAAKPPRKRDAPFAIRLSKDERARLTAEAKGAPLGSYIKAKALGTPPLALRRSGLAVEDRQALAKVLALLGASHLTANLSQLVDLAAMGALPVTVETEQELRVALRDVRAVRLLLLTALGMQPDGQP